MTRLHETLLKVLHRLFVARAINKAEKVVYDTDLEVIAATILNLKTTEKEISKYLPVFRIF